MRELDWIVSLLVDLHSFCERNGLSTLSDRVADAIEEAAPMIRGNWIDRVNDQEMATIARGTCLYPGEDGPHGPVAYGRPHLIYDAAAGAKP